MFDPPFWPLFGKRACSDEKYALVRPGWSSLKVRKPLFMSSVRGAKILAVAVCGGGRHDSCGCSCCCCCCCCCCTVGANRCFVTACGRSRRPALSEESRSTAGLPWNRRLHDRSRGEEAKDALLWLEIRAIAILEFATSALNRDFNCNICINNVSECPIFLYNLKI